MSSLQSFWQRLLKMHQENGFGMTDLFLPPCSFCGRAFYLQKLHGSSAGVSLCPLSYTAFCW